MTHEMTDEEIKKANDAFAASLLPKRKPTQPRSDATAAPPIVQIPAYLNNISSAIHAFEVIGYSKQADLFHLTANALANDPELCGRAYSQCEKPRKTDSTKQKIVEWADAKLDAAVAELRKIAGDAKIQAEELQQAIEKYRNEIDKTAGSSAVDQRVAE